MKLSKSLELRVKEKERGRLLLSKRETTYSLRMRTRRRQQFLRTLKMKAAMMSCLENDQLEIGKSLSAMSKALAHL